MVMHPFRNSVVCLYNKTMHKFEEYKVCDIIPKVLEHLCYKDLLEIFKVNKLFRYYCVKLIDKYCKLTPYVKTPNLFEKYRKLGIPRKTLLCIYRFGLNNTKINVYFSFCNDSINILYAFNSEGLYKVLDIIHFPKDYITFDNFKEKVAKIIESQKNRRPQYMERFGMVMILDKIFN